MKTALKKPYQLKYLSEISPEDSIKLSKMIIPNNDDKTDENQWVENGKKRIHISLKMLDDAVEVFLGK